MPTVGVIGLGAMGGAIAARLAHQQLNVYGYDINPASVERLVAAGGKGSSTSMDDVVSLAEIIITSVPNADILRSVLQSGLLERLQPKHSFVEMSTILPQEMEEIAGLIGDRVAEVVDAPVSGGPPQALEGKLSLLVGVGTLRNVPEPHKAQLQPRTEEVLSKLDSINLVGSVGQGKIIKLINNMISLGTPAVVVEALQLGAYLGLDYSTMYDVLSRSGAASVTFNERVPYVLENDFSARFRYPPC